jgi:hypothetical protein
MKKLFSYLSIGAMLISLQSCEELEDVLGISLSPTFEETFNIHLPDSSNPGVSQSMYMAFYRMLDFSSQDAPKELRDNVESAADVDFKELILKIEGVEGEANPIEPATLSGSIVFFPGELYNGHPVPNDIFGNQGYPEEIWNGDEIAVITLSNSAWANNQQWKEDDGEGTFSLSLSSEKAKAISSHLESKRKIGYVVLIEFNGEMPFSAEAIVGMKVDLSVNPK